MTCQKCHSSRVAQVGAKCSDMFYASLWPKDPEAEEPHRYEGYVPSVVGLGAGDYLNFRLCLDCGQNQGHWPHPPIEQFGEVDEG